MINIDTESTLYVCTDGTNGEVHILAPKRNPHPLYGGLPTGSYKHIEQLCLDDPDPYGPNGSDAAVFKLLCESDMEHHTFLI
jgi:hypothetical protein